MLKLNWNLSNERIRSLCGNAAHVLVPDHPHVAVLAPRVAPRVLDDPVVEAFLVAVSHNLEKYMELHPTFMFIGKPSCGKGGEGIMLL